MNALAPTPRQNLIREIKLRLGGDVVRQELKADHFDFAITSAIDRYRLRSQNAVEESFIVLDVQPDVQVYTLPPEVQKVMDIYRRNIGSGGGGASIDPFSLAFTNSMYMAMNPGGIGQGSTGALVNYHLGMSYQKLIGLMFGGEITFTWNASTKKLFMERKFNGPETVLIHVWNAKPEEMLITDVNAKSWVRDFATAECKMMLGEVRSKFSSGIGGPQGNITLNGDALKAEAAAEFARLEIEVAGGMDGDAGYGFCIG